MRRTCIFILVVVLIMNCYGCNTQETEPENSITLDTLWSELSKEISDLPSPSINDAKGNFKASIDNITITGTIDEKNRVTFITFQNKGFDPQRWFGFTTFEKWEREVCYLDLNKMTLNEAYEFLQIDNPISELKVFYSIVEKNGDPFELAVKSLLGVNVPKIINWNVSTSPMSDGIAITLQFTA